MWLEFSKKKSPERRRGRIGEGKRGEGCMLGVRQNFFKRGVKGGEEVGRGMDASLDRSLKVCSGAPLCVRIPRWCRAGPRLQQVPSAPFVPSLQNRVLLRVRMEWGGKSAAATFPGNHWATGLKKGIGSEGGRSFAALVPLFISLPRHCCLPSFPHPPPPFSLVFVASASLALARKGGKEEKFVPPLSPFVSSPPPPFLFLSRGKRERRRKLFLQVPSPTHLVPRRGFAAVEALTFIGFDCMGKEEEEEEDEENNNPTSSPSTGPLLRLHTCTYNVCDVKFSKPIGSFLIQRRAKECVAALSFFPFLRTNVSESLLPRPRFRAECN